MCVKRAREKQRTRRVLSHRAVRLADAIVVNIALSDGICLSVLEVMMMRGGDGNFLLLSSFYDVSFSFLFPFEGLFAPKTLKKREEGKCPHG